MKVLLTGATGFIGSHVARLLVREGHETYAVLRNHHNVWRIEDIVHKLKVVSCDLSAGEALNAHLSLIKPDVCLHLAWYAEPGKYLDGHENLSLVTASLSLVSQLARQNCARFVMTGSCFEYDTSVGYLSEKSPVKADSLYAASKLAVELVTEQLAKTTGMSVAWPRLFYQYGPFEDPRRLVPSVICSLLRGERARVSLGEQVRDFLHVDDVAEAIWAVATSDLRGPVNIGSGRPVTVRSIAERIGALLNRSDLIDYGALPYEPSEQMSPPHS